MALKVKQRKEANNASPLLMRRERPDGGLSGAYDDNSEESEDNLLEFNDD